MVKIRSSLGGNIGPELDSLLVNIFSDLEAFTARRIETTTLAGDLYITDTRISSLIREKDAELNQLRSDMAKLRKTQVTVGVSEAHIRTIQILQDENAQLKNEINELRVELGSSELVASYKAQVQQLNVRILELEQEKSNLSSELLNLRHEMEVKIQVQEFNSRVDIKRSEVTGFEGSGSKHITSPVGKFNTSSISSPKEEIDIPLIKSKYEASSTSGTKPTGDIRRQTAEEESSRSTYAV